MRRLLYQDEARLEYGRMFWADPRKRQRLLDHWLDARHPSHERFLERWRPIVARVLEAILPPTTSSTVSSKPKD